MKPQELSLALWRRLAWIGWALVILFWIPFEDAYPHGAIYIAGLAMWLLAARAGSWRSTARWRKRLGQVGICTLQGGAAGLLTAPFAMLLMLVKSGLHVHRAPEYSLEQFQWVLVRTPVWITVGGLIGLACGLLSAAHEKNGQSEGF